MLNLCEGPFSFRGCTAGRVGQTVQSHGVHSHLPGSVGELFVAGDGIIFHIDIRSGSLQRYEIKSIVFVNSSGISLNRYFLGRLGMLRKCHIFMQKGEQANGRIVKTRD